MTPLQIKLSIIGAIIAIVLGGSNYFIYNYAKMQASEDCNKRMLAYQEVLKEKISSIENDMTRVAKAAEAREVQMAEDIATILEGVKKKPVTIIKNGQCNPQATFLEGINSAINRANGK